MALAKERKKHKEKMFKKQCKHKNEQMQKEPLQVGHLNACPYTKR